MEISSKQRKLNYVGVFAIFFLQMIDNFLKDLNVNNTIIFLAKNGCLMVVCALFLWEIYLLRKNGKNSTFNDEMKSILAMAGVFLLLSIYYMIKNNGVHMVTFEGIFRIMLPMVVAYAVLNVMMLNDIYKLMTVLLVVTFVGYLISQGLENLTLENLMSISLVESYSPFESNYFSPTAVGFCLFFCYYRRNKFLTLLSVVFTIMTFKRFMIIYSLFLFLTGWLLKKLKKMPKILEVIFGLIFFGITIFYIQLMLGDVEDIIYQILGISANQFTMGRAWLMNDLIFRGFESTGFYTTTLNYRSIEMDFPQIYLEMGYFSIIATIYFLLRLVKQNWYNFFVIVFCLVQLLTSHWFDITYFWIVMYITIGCVAYKSDDKIDKKRQIRFVFR